MSVCQVNYMQVFRDQLATAFDVYLNILRHVRSRVDQKLGRDGPDWYMKNACPPCSYKVDFHAVPHILFSSLHS
jgi:hypothetical protein